MSAFRVATWLKIAATPTFATMAILSHAQGDGALGAICGAAPSLLGGMAPMYLLMSLFHCGPWLRVISRPRYRRGAGHQPGR